MHSCQVLYFWTPCRQRREIIVLLALHAIPDLDHSGLRTEREGEMKIRDRGEERGRGGRVVKTRSRMSQLLKLQSHLEVVFEILDIQVKIWLD